MFHGWGEDLLRPLSFRSHIREVEKTLSTKNVLSSLKLMFGLIVAHLFLNQVGEGGGGGGSIFGAKLGGPSRW